MVKEEIESMGVKPVFSGVLMRPGGSTLFTLVEGKPFFALPGRPGAARIAFEELVRPLILKLSGCNQVFRPVVSAMLEEEVGSIRGVRGFIPCLLKWDRDKYLARPVKRGFNGIMIIPENRVRIKAKEYIKAQILYGEGI